MLTQLGTGVQAQPPLVQRLNQRGRVPRHRPTSPTSSLRHREHWQASREGVENEAVNLRGVVGERPSQGSGGRDRAVRRALPCDRSCRRSVDARRARRPDSSPGRPNQRHRVAADGAVEPEHREPPRISLRRPVLRIDTGVEGVDRKRLLTARCTRPTTRERSGAGSAAAPAPPPRRTPASPPRRQMQRRHLVELTGRCLLLQLEERPRRVQRRRDHKHAGRANQTARAAASVRRAPPAATRCRANRRNAPPRRGSPASWRDPGSTVPNTGSPRSDSPRASVTLSGRLGNHLLGEDRRGGQEPLDEAQRNPGLLPRGRNDADRELLARQQVLTEPRRKHGPAPRSYQSRQQAVIPDRRPLRITTVRRLLKLPVDQADQPLLPRPQLQPDQAGREVSSVSRSAKLTPPRPRRADAEEQRTRPRPPPPARQPALGVRGPSHPARAPSRSTEPMFFSPPTQEGRSSLPPRRHRPPGPPPTPTTVPQ